MSANCPRWLWRRHNRCVVQKAGVSDDICSSQTDLVAKAAEKKTAVCEAGRVMSSSHVLPILSVVTGQDATVTSPSCSSSLSVFMEQMSLLRLLFILWMISLIIDSRPHLQGEARSQTSCFLQTLDMFSCLLLCFNGVQLNV